VRFIGLDLHAPAAAVALLAPPQFAVHKLLVHAQARGQTREKRHQRLAVRFPGRVVAEHKRTILTERAGKGRIDKPSGSR
jgi:hypothetical protein